MTKDISREGVEALKLVKLSSNIWSYNRVLPHHTAQAQSRRRLDQTLLGRGGQSGPEE